MQVSLQPCVRRGADMHVIGRYSRAAASNSASQYRQHLNHIQHCVQRAGSTEFQHFGYPEFDILSALSTHFRHCTTIIFGFTDI